MGTNEAESSRDKAGLGAVIRRRRQELAWPLQRLADAAGCSKAYLSGIENGHYPHPPSHRLLCRLERALEITAGQLTRLAEWQSTPASIRADFALLARQVADRRTDGAVNLDALYRSGELRRAIDPHAANIARVAPVCFEVPLINKVAAGYPRDFTDLDYPARVADEAIGCPGVNDVDAFAAIVVGQSMMPEYREGDIIVFSPARQPVDGADCFVRLMPDHHTTFKRVYFETGERVRLQPLNPAFDAVVVALSEVSGLYPAVYRVQRLSPAPAPAPGSAA